MTFLFVAHTHGFLDDISMLQKVLKKYAPVLVLHEQLQHIQDVSSLSKDSELYQENKEIIALCSSIPLRGFDMENFGLSSELQTKIETNSLSSTDIDRIEEILLQREQLHVSLLQELHEEGLVLVLVGAWHLRKNGLIRNSFPDANYILVVDEKGNECLAPSSDVKFLE